MHDAARKYIADELPRVDAPAGLVVEIGSKDINGTVRDLFAGRPYIGVDVVAGNGVDVIADGAVYQPVAPAAIVLCLETLEHSPEPASICANAYQMLQPGGVLFVTAAGPGRAAHSAIDGGPLTPGEYYANIDPEDLRAWLSAFSQVEVQVNRVACDVYATAIKADV